MSFRVLFSHASNQVYEDLMHPEVFEFEITGPGRWPTLCDDCRQDPEARYYTRRRKR